jgi:hypothetical protein
MAITIIKRSSEIPDEVYLAIQELGERPEFEGDWRVNVIPAQDNDDWTAPQSSTLCTSCASRSKKNPDLSHRRKIPLRPSV